MSSINAKKLVEKLSKDKKFKDEFIADETKAALKFAKKVGLECTAEELMEASGGGVERRGSVIMNILGFLFGSAPRGNPMRFPK